MKRLIAAVILLVLITGCLSGQAKASADTGGIPVPTGQWIDAGNSGAAQVYFQPVQSNGVTAHFWMRVDFNQPLQSGVFSQLLFQEAKCNQGIYNTRYLVNFNVARQLLAQGIPTDTNTPVIVSPDSPAGTAFKLVCFNRIFSVSVLWLSLFIYSG